MNSFQSITFRSYSKSSGWSDWVKVGTISGKPDSNDALTSLQFKYTGVGKLDIQTYLESKEWVQASSDGSICGDTQCEKIIHALRMSLKNAAGYHVFYRVCFEDGNWTHWKRDGDMVGDTACQHYIVALDVRFAMDEPHLQYRLYIFNVGWTNFVGDNQVAGLEGKGQRAEALYIHYTGPGRIMLRCHVQNYGWMSDVQNDMVGGTQGKGLRLEAIQLRLVEAEGYHIYYSVCVKGMGWQPWVKDGETAGTEGKSTPLEALRIRIAL